MRAKEKPVNYRASCLPAVCVLAGVLLCLLPACPLEETPSDNPNAATRLLQASLKYPTGAQPFALALAEFNGDGRKDIATANQAANTVSVLLAKPAGGYVMHVDYPVGTAPSALAAADVNGDSAPDLISANNVSNDLSLLLGAGDGTFAAETRLALAANTLPLCVVAGDLDADGKVDLVSADNGTNTVSVLLGAGGGTFAAPASLAVGVRPRWVILADLNNDTRPDIVTANRDSNNLSVLFNQGGGAFAAVVNLSAGTNPRMPGAADLNGDHWLDLITTNTGSGDISVLMNQGGGTFAPEVRLAFEDYVPTRFVLADFNNDNHTDLATVLFSTGDGPVAMGLMAVLAGDGTGNFALPRLFGVGIGSFDLAAAQMNSDTRLDIVTADYPVNQVAVNFGRAGGGFECEERFAAGGNPRVVEVADLDRDNNPDLVVLNQESRDVSILLGRGDSTFEPQTVVRVSDLPRALAVGKVNADQYPDLVVTNLFQSRVSVFLGEGDGTFQDERFFTVRAPTTPFSSEPRSVALADLDGDGINDILTGNSKTDSIGVLLGLGNGNFGGATETAVGNFPLDAHLLDINADGKRDLVFASTNDPDTPTDEAQPRLVRMFGNGNGTFDIESIQRYETGPQPRGLALGDLNGDGMADAVTVHTVDDSVYLLLGRAGGAFLRGTRLRMDESPNSVALGDLNDDLLPDIITTNDVNLVSVLINRGEGRFQSPMSFPGGSQPIGGVVADINKDSHPDVIMPNRDTNDVSVLLGVP